MKKISPASLIIIILFIISFSYAAVKKYVLKKHALYTKGISKGVSKGVRGNLTLDYIFTINGEEYQGFVPSSFCANCKNCCKVGDSVIVRYENGNPKNNDLVEKLPDGESF